MRSKPTNPTTNQPAWAPARPTEEFNPSALEAICLPTGRVCGAAAGHVAIRYRHTGLIKFLALLFAIVLVAVGCGGSSDSSELAATASADSRDGEDTASRYEDEDAEEADFAMTDDMAEEAVASEESMVQTESGFVADESPDSTDSGSATAGNGSSEASLAVPTALTPADLGRDIIYKADVSVEVEDVAAASREATEIVTSVGGIVFEQRTSTRPRSSTVLVFKVLPSDFSAVLDRLSSVGELVAQSISAEDVTERVVDLQSRISTAEASVTRLRKFIETAPGYEEVARLENQLLQRETTLEVLRGQLRTLQEQVALATITLKIRQSPEVRPDTGVRVDFWISDNSEDPCFGSQVLTAEPDSTVSFCLEVENLGEAALTDLTLRSEPLRIDRFSFDRVDGDFDRIESGERLVATLTIPMSDGRLGDRVATRGLTLWLEVTATPVDKDGEALAEVADSSNVYLEVEEDDSLPGFADSIESGASVLATIGGVLLVLTGLVIPFLPFLVVFAAIVWWLTLRSKKREQATRQGHEDDNNGQSPNEPIDAMSDT